MDHDSGSPRCIDRPRNLPRNRANPLKPIATPFFIRSLALFAILAFQTLRVMKPFIPIATTSNLRTASLRDYQHEPIDCIPISYRTPQQASIWVALPLHSGSDA